MLKFRKTLNLILILLKIQSNILSFCKIQVHIFQILKLPANIIALMIYFLLLLPDIQEERLIHQLFHFQSFFKKTNENRHEILFTNFLQTLLDIPT